MFYSFSTSEYEAKLFAMSVDDSDSPTESFDSLNSRTNKQGEKLVVYHGDYYILTTYVLCI